MLHGDLSAGGGWIGYWAEDWARTAQDEGVQCDSHDDETGRDTDRGSSTSMTR
jgi:hypothetical protein